MRPPQRYTNAHPGRSDAGHTAIAGRDAGRALATRRDRDSCGTSCAPGSRSHRAPRTAAGVARPQAPLDDPRGFGIFAREHHNRLPLRVGQQRQQSFIDCRSIPTEGMGALHDIGDQQPVLLGLSGSMSCMSKQNPARVSTLGCQAHRQCVAATRQRSQRGMRDPRATKGFRLRARRSSRSWATACDIGISGLYEGAAV